MPQDDPIHQTEMTTNIGFYKIQHLESIGYCGGYLILNRNGRPIEFHCTLPINPDRALQILYGDSLMAHLYCEHIGPALIGKASTPVRTVFVDDSVALALEENIKPPVALVEQIDTDAPGFRGNGPEATESVNQFVTEYQSLNWMEPFGRIQSAIDEAHAVAR